MDRRYIRNIPALSEAECAALRDKRVLVVGCGGLGGYIIEMLTRLGVGAIRAVDGDCFEESNLNRQLYSLPDLLGTSKAKAAKVRIEAVNPDVKAECGQTFLNAENAGELVSGCDLVMDALDNIESRKILAAACNELNVPLVYGAIAGWAAQAAISLPGDNLIEKLYPEGIEIRDKSALSFTPSLCASLQCALAAAYLCGREVKSGTVYFFDLLNMDFESLDLS